MRPRHCLLAPAIAFLLLLSACGGSSKNQGLQRETTEPRRNPPATQPPGAPGLARSLPTLGVDSPLGSFSSLPAPSTIDLRYSSFTQAEGHRNGAEYDAALPNNRVLSSLVTLGFTPDYSSGEALSELSFALFSFDLPGAGTAISADLNWANGPSLDNLFVALANYDTDRWDWFKPAAVSSFSVPDVQPYLDDMNHLVLAIAVTGTIPASLTDIQLQASQPPQAVLESDVTAGLAPLTVIFDASSSSDPDGSITNYEWDFDGDGNFGEADLGEDLAGGLAQPAAVTYDNPGTYNATVRVTDDLGATASASLPIDVNGAPSVELNANPSSGGPGLDVTFDTVVSDDGTIDNYEWDFDGDTNFNEADNGEAAAQGLSAAQANYPDVGSFAATVRVTDNKGATAQDSVDIFIGGIPSVNLTAVPESGNKPLDVQFTADASDDGTITNYEWDFDGDTNFNEADNGEDLAEGQFQASHQYQQAGIFDATVRVTDDSLNLVYDNISITVNNQAPVADLQATPTSGAAPLLVDFDASGSYDSDGTITDYEWDLDGDGTFNESGTELDSQGSSSVNDYVFTNGGSYDVVVRVTDSDSATDTATINISVSSWTIVTLSSGAGVDGTNASMALINGNPAVAWRRVSPTAGLRYMRSTTQLGANGDWGSNQTVLNANVAQYGTSLIQIGARVCIAYQHSDGTLHLVRDDGSGNWSGPMASNIVVDNNSTDTGRWPSAKMIGSNPAIGYTDFLNGNVMYVRSSAVDGGSGSWAGKVTVFDGTTSAYSDMQMVNGNPAMTFCDNTGQILKFIRSSTAGGDLAADWSGTNMCDVATGVLAINCGLTTANGNPGIGYIDANADVRFARSSTAGGSNTADWTAGSNVVVKALPSVTYQFSRVNFLLGVPVFAYSDVTAQDQYFSSASNANGDGSASWNEELVDGAGTQMNEASNIILLSNGQPAFCYHDVDNDDLKYAYRN